MNDHLRSLGDTKMSLIKVSKPYQVEDKGKTNAMSSFYVNSIEEIDIITDEAIQKTKFLVIENNFERGASFGVENPKPTRYIEGIKKIGFDEAL